MTLRAERFAVYAFVLLSSFVGLRQMERNAWLADERLEIATRQSIYRIILTDGKKAEKVEHLYFAMKDLSKSVWGFEEPG